VISSAAVSKHYLACLSFLLLVPGCSFNPSPVEGDPDDPPGDTPDARPPGDGAPGSDGRAPDAGPACDGAALQPVLRVAGTAATDGQQSPVVEVLLGDVVEISAANSCGGQGTLSYEWSISPEEGILATAAPALTEKPQTFEVYPTAAGDYTVTLTVRDAGGTMAETSALAIRAHGWQATAVPPAMLEVRDLSVGGGNLWVASEGGAFSLPLAGPLGVFTPVAVTGDTVPNDLNAVHFDARTQYLWFGHAGDLPGPWRLDTTMDPPASVQINWDVSAAFNGTAQTFDFIAFGTDTIIAATSKGITAVDGNESEFSGQIQPDDRNPAALGTGNGRRFAGAQRLYELPEEDVLFDIGTGADNKIRAIVNTSSEALWIGTDTQGVVLFDLRTNTPGEPYNEANSGLGSNKIRALVVEAGGPYAGDVWAATDAGVSRYISQRDTWIHMDAAHGLEGHLDLNTLAIDTDQGRRVIYGGSTAGVVYIRKP
jgi:PKD repeat protein